MRKYYRLYNRRYVSKFEINFDWNMNCIEQSLTDKY